MTALAQGAAGVALVMALALLGARQVSAAILLLCAQSIAVATAALAQQQFVIAGLTVITNVIFAVTLLRRQAPAFDVSAPQPGGTKLGILAGVALTLLSQAHAIMAGPLALLLLAILLIATRRHSLMHLIALISLQNGLSLAASATNAAPLAALPGFALAAPFALVLCAEQPTHRHWRFLVRLTPALGWIQVGIAIALLCGSLFAPLDPIGALFVPLLAAWGLACAWANRNRRRPLAHRAADIVGLVAMLLAGGTTSPVGGIVALSIAAAAWVLPTARRRLDALLLGSCGTALALFGLGNMSVDESTISAGSLLFGIAAIAAMAPDLAALCGIILLRLSVLGPWPAAAPTILGALAAVALTGCAVTLMVLPAPGARMALLRIALLLLVAVGLSLDGAQGGFASVTLLILMILTDAAVRLTRSGNSRDLARAAATAGLAGLPPAGTFAGIVLLVRASAAASPWMLLPIGLALVAMMRAGLPSSLPAIGRLRPPSPAWLPLGLAIVFGFMAPEALIGWVRAIVMSPPR